MSEPGVVLAGLECQPTSDRPPLLVGQHTSGPFRKVDIYLKRSRACYFQPGQWPIRVPRRWCLTPMAESLEPAASPCKSPSTVSLTSSSTQRSQRWDQRNKQIDSIHLQSASDKTGHSDLGRRQKNVITPAGAKVSEPHGETTGDVLLLHVLHVASALVHWAPPTLLGCLGEEESCDINCYLRPVRFCPVLCAPNKPISKLNRTADCGVVRRG